MSRTALWVFVRAMGLAIHAGLVSMSEDPGFGQKVYHIKIKCDGAQHFHTCSVPNLSRSRSS